MRLHEPARVFRSAQGFVPALGARAGALGDAARIHFRPDQRLGGGEPLVRGLGQTFALSAAGRFPAGVGSALPADGAGRRIGRCGARCQGARAGAGSLRRATGAEPRRSPLFFGLHEITKALVLLGAIDLAVLLTLVLFWRVRVLAGALLVPYLAWVLFATVLNWQFLALNPDADGMPTGNAVTRVQL